MRTSHAAVIGPNRGRQAPRRPCLAVHFRLPCFTPFHATTGAAPMFHPWTIPSSTLSATCRGAHAGRSCSTIRLRALSCASARLPPLRPRAVLLLRDGAPTVATRRRPALAGQPARSLRSCCANPALARTPSGVGHVHANANAVGDRVRAVRSAIGDASGFPIGGLGCCTGHPFIDARGRSRTCTGVTQPAMQDRHNQQRVHGGHAGKLGCRRPRADHLADLALPLVPNTLRGTRAVGLPAPHSRSARHTRRKGDPSHGHSP